MMVEACQAFGWLVTGARPRLQQRPADVQRLTEFRQRVDEVLASQFQILTIVPAMMAAATLVSQQTGLLTNDALVVAVMQANGITHLASHDADFDRVPGLSRYAPA